MSKNTNGSYVFRLVKSGKEFGTVYSSFKALSKYVAEMRRIYPHPLPSDHWSIGTCYEVRYRKDALFWHLVKWRKYKQIYTDEGGFK